MNIYQYLNCYAMLEEVRTELNEYNEKLCQGTETGVFDNSDIVRKLNISQKFIFNMLFVRLPEIFLTSSSVSGTAGVYTIPADLFQLVNVTNSNGDRINPISVKVKHLQNSSGSDYLYYRSGNTIVRDGGGSDALTFNYYKAVRDLTQGQSAGGSATTITLGRNAKGVADYYNSVVLENVSDNWSANISDYTSARVATVGTRSSSGKFYGTVSELPDPFHSLITKKAVLLLKDTIVSPQRPEASEISNFREELVDTLRAFTGTGDMNIAELFYSFRPYV